MANLEQSGNYAPGAWYADISKIKKFLVLKAIYSKTTYMRVLIHQISRIILMSFRKRVILTNSLLTAKQTLKKPT